LGGASAQCQTRRLRVVCGRGAETTRTHTHGDLQTVNGFRRNSGGGGGGGGGDDGDGGDGGRGYCVATSLTVSGRRRCDDQSASAGLRPAFVRQLQGLAPLSLSAGLWYGSGSRLGLTEAAMAWTDRPVEGRILLQGYLRKLKRMKKKYFVLWAGSEAGGARLEYFDSEKKQRNGQGPKCSIEVHQCFNINRRHDAKHRLVVVLHTHDDCFPVAFDTEEELDLWLDALLRIHLEGRLDKGQELRPLYGASNLLSQFPNM